MPATTPPVHLLRSVLVELRTEAGEQTGALPHAVAAISEFLDREFPWYWSLPRVCEANLVLLLSRLVTQGMADGVDLYYWKHQCGQGLVSAVKHDNLEMDEWLHLCCPSMPPYSTTVEAARAGNMQLLEWLSDRHESAVWLPLMADKAALAGQTVMLKYLRSHPKCGVVRIKQAMTCAVRGGHLDTLQWLYEHHPTARSMTAMVNAAWSDQFKQEQ